MTSNAIDVHGTRVFLLATEGPELRTANDAVDAMSAASEFQSTFIAIPVERLGDDFFNLSTRIAGEIVQKFVTYGRQLVVLGDISARIASSKSLAAFVIESNRGKDLWFVKDVQALAERLSHVAKSDHSTAE
jgi:hypothetical protein